MEKRATVSLFAGIGGFDYAMEKAGCEVVAQVEKEPFCLAVLETHWPKVAKFTDIKEFGASRLGFRARTGASQESGQESAEHAADCSLNSCASYEKYGLDGLSLKMFPDCYLPTPAEISPSFSHRWPKSGSLQSRTEFWTVSTSEWPKDAAVCTLSAVLEKEVPRRFFLSSRAAAGILRRAAKRGRTLPTHLQQALEALATGTGTDGTQTTSQKDSSETEMGTADSGMSAESSSKPSPRNGRKAQAGQREMNITTPSSQIPSENPTVITDEAARAETDVTIFSPCEISESTEKITQPCESQAETVAPTLSTKNEVASSSTQRQKWMEQCAEMIMTVRRLTPTECETLQNFPRGWTIPDSRYYPKGLTRRDTGRSETL